MTSLPWLATPNRSMRFTYDEEGIEETGVEGERAGPIWNGVGVTSQALVSGTQTRVIGGLD